MADLFSTLSRGDGKEHCRLAISVEWTVKSVERFPLKLNNVALLEVRDVAVSKSLVVKLSFWIEEILKLVVLLQGIFSQQVIEINEINGDQLLALGRQPVDLLVRLFDIAVEMKLQLQLSHSITRFLNLPNNRITPDHKRDLFVLFEGFGVFLL